MALEEAPRFLAAHKLLIELTSDKTAAGEPAAGEVAGATGGATIEAQAE
jgi:hypothetical protein